MLVNLLSGKSFLAQIVLGILFLVSFFLKIYPVTLDWQDITGLIFLILAVAISIVFFLNTSLIKNHGFALWFFFIWILTFFGNPADYKIAISLLICSLIFWRFLVAEHGWDNKKFLFEIGFLLNVSSFFYPPSFFLIGFLMFVYIYMQSFNFRGFLLFLIGFSLPLVIEFQLLYLTNQTEWLQAYQSAFCLNFWNLPLWPLIPLGILIIAAWLDHLSQAATQDINKRQKYFLSFLYFINWIVIIMLYGGDNLGLLAFLGIPITLFLSRFTQYQKSKIAKEIILWSFLIILAGFYFRFEILEIYEDLLGNVAF